MTCSKLHNKTLKTKSQEFKHASKKERSLCVAIVRKAKKNCCNNLNVRNITHNKLFRKTIKPFFSIKIGSNERITTTEEDKVVSEDNEEAETFTSCFETLVDTLGINSKYMSDDPVSNENWYLILSRNFKIIQV